MLTYGTTTIDLVAHQVRSEDGARDLTRLEVEALAFLADRRGQVVLREALEREVWGFRAGVRSEAVPVAMRRLRAKLGRDDILTVVTGRGWRLEHPEAGPGIPAPPRFATPLTGRGALLDAIDESRARGWRVVTLRGPAGVGKTRVLWESARRWPGVVVPLSVDGPLATAAQLRDRLAGAMGLEQSDRDTILRWFGGLSRPLLVIDDADLAVEGARALADDLVDETDAAVLFAARAPLGARGETVVEVPPLSLDEARTFFLDRLAVRPSASEGEALDAVIEGLDRLPLALELYAPEAALGLGALAESLLEHDLPTRLRLAVERGWVALPATARDVLLACAAFAGPFDREAALAAAGHDRDALAVLRERSLLHLDPDGRFRVLRSVRAFCRQQPAYPDAAARAHGWVRGVAEGLAAVVLAEPARAIAGMRALLPHLRDVVAEGRPDDAERAALAAVAVIEHTGPDTTLIALLEPLAPSDPDRSAAVRAARARALQHLRRPHGEVLAAIEGLHTPDAEVTRAQELQLEGRSVEAIAAFDALDATLPADLPVRVTVRLRGYWAAFAAGRPVEERAARVEAAVAVAERLGAGPMLPHALRARAHQRSLAGDLAGARSDLGRAMQIAERNGQHRLVAWLWGTLGQVELRSDLEAAVVALERAVQIARAGGDAFQFLAGLQMAGCRLLLDRPGEALDALGPILATPNARPRIVSLAHAYRGAALLALGRTAEGRLALDAVPPADLAFGVPGATTEIGAAYLAVLRAEEPLRALRAGDTSARADLEAVLADVAPVEATPAGQEALGLLLARLRAACRPAGGSEAEITGRGGGPASAEATAPPGARSTSHARGPA